MDPATLESLIVKELRKTKEISRRDLAERLIIAKSTAGRRIDSMIERGLVCESGIEDRKEVGRPRRFLALRGDYGAFAGFDFDARHLYGVLINYAGETLDQQKIRLSAEPTREEVLGHLRSLVASYRLHHLSPKMLGIGVGVPGHIRGRERLSVYYPFIADWRNVSLTDELGLDDSILHVENNTRAIALGEYWLANDGGLEDFICLNVRTGVSAAIISNGRLVTGGHEMAGEIRGWPVGDADWLEKVASVRAVTDGEPPGSDRWHEFVSACQEGDEAALALLDRTAGHHGEALARMVQLLDPQAIFAAGPFITLEQLYLDRVRATLASALEGQYFAPPPLRPASLGEFAGAHGAAALAAAEAAPPQ